MRMKYYNSPAVLGVACVLSGAIFISVVACGGFAMFRFAGSSSSLGLSRDQIVVRDYCLANANDPASVEFSGWKTVRYDSDGDSVVRVSVRERNGFGGKVLKKSLFYVSDGKVISTFTGVNAEALSRNYDDEW